MQSFIKRYYYYFYYYIPNLIFIFNDIQLGIKLSCDDEQGDSFIQQWKRNIIKDLCEANAISKINCFDSHVANSRICIFDNAMMDFKKMRYIQKPDGGMF